MDTQTGLINQLHFSVNKNDKVGVVPLSGVVIEGFGDKGRFTLYPTKNAYSFILLDQFTGKSWHVTWGLDEFFY